ncbi:hypothetical protein ABZ816_13485 [Actinosynnema sp. NPDC047251]|uniref:Uncharacterized protein n=1 Tax=Saccharothrix espanaensis (strain ATCC 51144 / DSM 44229 / JCM 9112 / NBRC 15066 / NRRL 15764) TaxID=1179773 RepID=K0KGH3_SACES|nr:hypothetical protein [Saccharothrix espanaensis]CCH35608.1 hypothetical protein BN6_83930 [Saccharothrix espanaensis DSM 44229]
MTPGSQGQNETYIGQRLLFQRTGEVEVGLADATSGADARRILKAAVIGAMLIGFPTFLLSVVISLAAGRGGSDFAGFLLVMAFLAPWLWIALVLFVPRVDVLSDWHLLLDGKADIADTAYGVVWRSLTVDRQTPVTVSPRRVRVGPPVAGVRNLLHVSLGRYYSYVSVFGFGRDLYLGWTLWRRRLPVMVVLRWIGSVFGGDPGYSGVIEMEPVKAMRESVHNALRQAIEAAVIGREIPLVETFGHDLPVETHGTGPRPRLVTVLYRTEVFSADGQPLGHVEPGVTYEVVADEPAGVTVRDNAGSTALLKDRAAVQW